MVVNKAATWLKNTLDYEFSNAQLLELALTHRSAPGDNNERLEFLGDAVLDFVISEVVFRTHPLAPEGDLSRLRASLVNDATLAEIAAQLGLGEHLHLGGGERKTGGHRRDSILADALEAIFGAVYLDAGFDAARHVIEKTFGQRLQNFRMSRNCAIPRRGCRNGCRRGRWACPTMNLLNVTGKAHRQTFEVSCSVNDTVTNGHGTTRRNAEQSAAEDMLVQLKSGELE